MCICQAPCKLAVNLSLLCITCTHVVFHQQPCVQDIQDQTTALKLRYEQLKGKLARMQSLLGVCGKAKKIAGAASKMHSERKLGSKRMRESGDALEAMFTILMYTIIGTATGLVLGATIAAALTPFTGGLSTPIAIALAGTLAAGGLVGGVTAAGVQYMRKKMKENAILDQTNNWILEDRARCEQLMQLITEFDRYWKALETLFPSRNAMDEHFRRCGIDAKELRGCYEEVKELSRRWREHGFGLHSEDHIRKAEEAVRTFLQTGPFRNSLLNAVTLFVDLETIGGIGYDVAYKKRKRPPIRELLRSIADGIEEDAAPAKRMAGAPWLNRHPSSVSC